MITDSRPRALVLGGGGLAGIAWEVGVLVGLADAGVRVADADRILGTSAGSVVGSLLATGADLAALHADHLAGRGGSGTGTRAVLDLEVLATGMLAAVSGASGARDARARIGAWALAADTVPESERREVIAGRLPDHRWPHRDLRITAVDAESGAGVVFTRADGVELVDAVAASCAVPGVYPPMTVGDRRYVDGGVRSLVGLDLADDPEPAGSALVVAPLDPPEGGPLPSVSAEIARRVAAHPEVVTVGLLADPESVVAFGPDVLDPASMPGAAEAGHRQGKAAAAEVAAMWS